MEQLHVQLRVPDLWQQEAMRHLQKGDSVLIDAPTGAGKTYVFESLIERGFEGQAVYTVPTRALANDKLFEWRARGWNVGIMTGDLAENTQAPVIVATLETQRERLFQRQGPKLLVVDEYQMIGDSSRGVHYELALALAPEDTQLLLLSGSVGNPEKVTRWLERIGRRVHLVSHQERPVPLEEIDLQGLPDLAARSVKMPFIRWICNALAAGLGPVLIFAPRRAAAERFARHLSTALPENDLLELAPEQRRLAGDSLKSLLRNRVAFHHSGLSYQQRAGLIEPLAKTGQLRVVVATTGLAAGINFSMRSVVITDREYRTGESHRLLRPDELLQMFGRAGRRGMDDRGYVLVPPGGTPLHEARPLMLHRQNQLDWPVCMSILREAQREDTDPFLKLEAVSQRLFSEQRIRLGFRAMRRRLDKTEGGLERELEERFTRRPESPAREIVEIQARSGQWERRRAPQKRKLADTWTLSDDKWRPTLARTRVLEGIRIGSLCKLRLGGKIIYGREAPVAQFPEESNADYVLLLPWLRRALRSYFRNAGMQDGKVPRKWELGSFEQEILPLMPALTQGGRLNELVERGGLLTARLDYSEAEIFALIDNEGHALLNPPQRKQRHEPVQTLLIADGPGAVGGGRTPAEAWHRLGLVDTRGCPTRRGTVFSFFSHGEGLAVAAALEDPNYPIEELLYECANLRAGHRFELEAPGSGRLQARCRQVYGGANYPGYLARGLPEQYGEGAAEIMRELQNGGQKQQFTSGELRAGDIERAQLEWRSILHHIASRPDYQWTRWQEFQALVRHFLAQLPKERSTYDLPPLPLHQRSRRPCIVRL